MPRCKKKHTFDAADRVIKIAVYVKSGPTISRKLLCRTRSNLENSGGIDHLKKHWK